MKRVTCLVAGLMLITVFAAAQAPPAGQKRGLAASMQGAYGTLKGNMTQVAEKMPEADYGFKPGSDPELATGTSAAAGATGQRGGRAPFGTRAPMIPCATCGYRRTWPRTSDGITICGAHPTSPCCYGQMSPPLHRHDQVRSLDMVPTYSLPGEESRSIPTFQAGILNSKTEDEVRRAIAIDICTSSVQRRRFCSSLSEPDRGWADRSGIQDGCRQSLLWLPSLYSDRGLCG
jgi:hypothetical protein